LRIVEILLVEANHVPGSLAKVLHVIGDNMVTVEGLNAVRRLPDDSIWEISIEYDEDDKFVIGKIIDGINGLSNARIVGKSDRVFNRHKGGKIKTVSTVKIDSLEVLRDVYTPGVARVCEAIQETPERVRELTNIKNTVAIVTNGTAILGLGNIGPVAGLPVMEGKAAILDSLADISGIPILIDQTDPLRVIEIVEAISPSFGGILLEDIRSPECFQIEEELMRRIPKPVFHDDQHGTAMVVLAALLTASRRLNIEVKDRVFGQIGLGASGMGICTLLKEYGVREVLGSDINETAITRLRAIGGEPATIDEIMRKADVVVATTGVKGLIHPDMVREGQIIMALSNPEPEIPARVALKNGAAFATDGATVNNMLAFPGLMRGALDSGAMSITQNMKIAVAETLSSLAKEEALVPSALYKDVHEQVAKAVYEVVMQEQG